MNTALCTNCGSAIRSSYGATEYVPGDYFMVDNGLCLDVAGHYGGFVDTPGYPGTAGGRYAFLCHDCSVRLADALPGVFAGDRGCGHPVNSGTAPPCCPYSWSTAEVSDPENPNKVWETLIPREDLSGWQLRESDL